MEKTQKINPVRNKTLKISANGRKYWISNGVKFIISLTAVIFAVLPAVASAATLHFSPSSGTYEVGKTFSVSVYVSSADQAMNAASGVISFPKDKLEISTLSKSGSIFSLWVQEPSFSNSVGVINFEGIVLNPGFTGSGGKIMTINFKVKLAGQAGLNFSSGSILANDGTGTNILGGMDSANYQLSAGMGTPTEQITKTKPTIIAGVPANPQVLSSTHPDSNRWYNNKNPQFSWTLPSGVNGVSFYFSQSPTSNPGSVSDGLLASKSYKNVNDGIWYFHIKMKNSAGWGPITHFKIQIDTVPPEPFIIKFIDGKETENPRPTILFDAIDSLSGVDYYKIKIGEGEASDLTTEKLAHNPYTLPLQAPGKRNILIQVFDKAGNYSVATDEFIIKPLKEPKFTDYPQELESGGILTVKGKSQYPSSQMVVWLQKEKNDPKSFTVESDRDGKFTFTADERLPDGIYQLWAEVVDARGARSNPTEKVTFAVEQPSIFKIGTQAVTILAIIVPLVALIILLLAFIWYGWHRFSTFRKKIHKETKETEEALHRAFKSLKEETEEQVAKLDGKPDLSEREKKICNNLKKALKISEEFISREIKDIEKEIKK